MKCNTLLVSKIKFTLYTGQNPPSPSLFAGLKCSVTVCNSEELKVFGLGPIRRNSTNSWKTNVIEISVQF